MRLFSKQKLVDEIQKLAQSGWHKSVKRTLDQRNDGAVGNTLERLLGIEENNLPIPNAAEWELKGQRKHSVSLITLKHAEPSPKAVKIVSKVLLPLYGWSHAQAGKKYPPTEMSFRSTTNAKSATNRGFKIVVDHEVEKIRFVFDASQVDRSDSDIAQWLASVEQRVGLGGIEPEPYWGFRDLQFAIGAKIRNCFYVVADTKIEDGHEHFKYEKLLILSEFSFEQFLKTLEEGHVYVDFDARTGHNHGTKFRLAQGHWPDLYQSVERIELS